MVLQPAVGMQGRVRGKLSPRAMAYNSATPIVNRGAAQQQPIDICSLVQHLLYYFYTPHLPVPGLNKLVSDIAFYFGNIFFDLLFFFFFADEQYLFGINDDTIIQPL